MKVILTDNYDRDHIADQPYRDDLSYDDATRIAAEYNQRENPNWYAIIVEDNYRLKRGVEDMI